MGSIMISCPATGHALPTGFRADRESFARMPVFFARAFCPHCNAHHEWFAREAWVDEAPVEQHSPERRVAA